MTYSLDFRVKVLGIRKKEKLSMAEAGQRFGIGVSTVMRWSKKLESQDKRNKPATKIDTEALKHDVELHPDGYQYERAQRLGVSRNCVHFALKRLGVSYKKNSEASKSRS